MEIKYFEFNVFEFDDITGTIRTIKGCSLANREELRERINSLKKILEESPKESTLQEIYDDNKYFRFNCHRCLELCGISLEWLDFSMMSQMLFPYQQGEHLYQGILISLNFPPIKDSKGGKGATYEEILAALWNHTGDLQKAIEAANSLPAEQLLNVVQARTDQLKQSDPQNREKDQQKEWQQRARQDLEQVRSQKA
jgi:hypothetical protein